MRMPGFTAEASFYRHRKHYQAGTHIARIANGEIVPQAALCWYDRWRDSICCCSDWLGC